MATTTRGYRYPGVNDAPDGPYSFQTGFEDVDADVGDKATRLAALEGLKHRAGVVNVTVNNATAAGSATVTFSSALPSVPSVTLTKATVSGAASSMRKLQPVVTGVTATGFTANLETADGANVGATFVVSCHWHAVVNA